MKKYVYKVWFLYHYQGSFVWNYFADKKPKQNKAKQNKIKQYETNQPPGQKTKQSIYIYLYIYRLSLSIYQGRPR